MKLEKKQNIGPFARKQPYEYEGKRYEADLKDGDVIRLNDAGKEMEGRYGEDYVFSVETRNGPKNLSLNQTSLNNLIDGYGSETEGWVGKDAQVFIIKTMVSGKLQDVVYLTPPGWIMTSDGSFSAELPFEDDIPSA